MTAPATSKKRPGRFQEGTPRVANRRHATNELPARVWEALSCGEGGDPRLARDLASALVTTPRAGWLHNALGLIEGRRNAQTAAGYFARAVECDAGDVMAGLNLAEAYALGGEREKAIEQAGKTAGDVIHGNKKDQTIVMV